MIDCFIKQINRLIQIYLDLHCLRLADTSRGGNHTYVLFSWSYKLVYHIPHLIPTTGHFSVSFIICKSIRQRGLVSKAILILKQVSCNHYIRFNLSYKS